MDRKLYYVSVQGRSMLANREATAYEWTICATAEEADTLGRMLEQIQQHEEDSFLAFTYPWPDTPEQGVSQGYQRHLDNLYREIYRLGTEETKEQLARSGYGDRMD
ncbi:hypothetical protein ACFQ3W_20785 [Paenibacillus puldeungensis]|uniref:Hydrolase n=1 Tax=Paenibacillus puldeungensis TaxID=696536 RepID=A0ABW3S1P8_9BACL